MLKRALPRPKPAADSNPKIPTLRSIEDLHDGLDLEKVINLRTLYEMDIDDGMQEHIARMGIWHPSSAGYCMRSTVMAFIKTPPTDGKSKRLKEIFEFGHAVHDIVQRRMARLGEHVKRQGAHYEFVSEVPCDFENDQLFTELGIGGTPDGIIRIWNKYFEQRALLEIKSQSDEMHKKLAEQPGAWPKHLMQSHIYAYRHDLPIIFVFYLNKNNQRRAIRTHKFEWEIFDQAIKYFETAGQFVKQGKLPPREESWFECSECAYRSMCNPAALVRKSGQPVIPARSLRRK